jgi:ribosomal protein L11 methyltransferase
LAWQQLRFRIARETQPMAEAALEAAGALAVTYEDATDTPLLEPAPGTTPLWADLVVTALFSEAEELAGLVAHLSTGIDLQAVEVERVEDQDWSMAWAADFHAMRFGEHLWVCPSSEEVTMPDAVVVRLDPGLAFGTGTHPTTALCLEWLDRHPPQGLEVIDYGCGSGLLAIAALKLGARHVTGVDIDPQALLASRTNAERNGLGPEALTAVLPEDTLAGGADLMLANILANPLIELAPRLCALLRPGGDLVLSGLLADQAEQVAAAYAPWCDMRPPVHREEWVRLEGRRREH